MVDLKSAPFFLSEDAIAWVNRTLAAMTLEEKVGHLFCPVGLTSDRAVLGELITRFKPAGIMFRPGSSEEVQETHRFLQQTSPLPLLIASNLESGGCGASVSGTEFGSQMQIAATQDPEQAARLGEVCAREGKALGCNWAFAPVVDIDYNPHNPITNTRTFGNNPARVADMASRYIVALQREGMAAAAKHFPGDGTDFRDQHIALTFNHLSCEEWDRTYGQVFQAIIASGTLSLMTGHIALPAYSQHFSPHQAEAARLPASLSRDLLQGLLRERLGFNGVIVTDATPMVGFTSVMPRRQAVPAAIAAGCDIFLFNKSLEEDFGYMLDGIRDGLLSEARVDEAVTRTLTMKAALKLHLLAPDARVPATAALEVVGCDAHHQLAVHCADRSVTLVKDTLGVLPVRAAERPRVLVYTLTDDGDFFGRKVSIFDHALSHLQARGFETTLFDPEQYRMRDTVMSVEAFKANYDWVLYLAHIKPASNKTSLRVSWARPMGINAPWFSAELPTVFISFGNPYHLIDVPLIPVYINAYTGNATTITAALDKVMGHSPFHGLSPVDPSAGLLDVAV